MLRDFSPKIESNVISFYVLQAVFSFITMQLQLCSVFFTFSLGTRTHYFGRTILHGGAKVCTGLLLFSYKLIFCFSSLYYLLDLTGYFCMVHFTRSIEQLVEGLLSVT